MGILARQKVGATVRACETHRGATQTLEGAGAVNRYLQKPHGRDPLVGEQGRQAECSDEIE